MKIFTNVSELKLAKLKENQLVETKGYYTPGDGGQARYLIQTPAQYSGTPDEYGDHTLANGNIAVLQYEAGVYPEWFGADGSVANDTTAWKKAIAYAESKYTGIACPPKKIYYINEELQFQKPIIVDLNFSVLYKDPLYTGYLLSVNNTRRGTNRHLYYPPQLGLPSWKTEADNNGFVLKNVILFGDNRQSSGNGIIFRGGNSDVLLDNVYIYSFKGTGLAACDPDSFSGDDANDQYIRESLFRNVTIQDCGDLGKPSYIIGRNSRGGSNHNNLRHQEFNVVYPRKAVGISIVNKNATAFIQHVYFDRLLLRGNVSLANPDVNGEDVYANSDLMVVGDTGNVGNLNLIRVVNSHLLEQEDGYSALRINADCDIIIDSTDVASKVVNKGVVVNGCGNVLMSNNPNFQYPNKLVFESPPSLNKTITLSGCSSKEFGSETQPNVVVPDSTYYKYLVDYSQKTYLFNYRKDVSATDTLPLTVFMHTTPPGEYFVRAYIVPSEYLAASYSSFATIFIYTYNADGALRLNASLDTREVSWPNKVKIDLPVLTDKKLPGAVAVRITKSGYGVILPAFTLCVVTSKSVFLS